MLPVVILFAAYVLLAAFIAGSTSLHAAMEMAYESNQDRKRKRIQEDENRPLMKNLFVFNAAPQLPLGEYEDLWERFNKDPNRLYCKKLTHMFSWEILDLYALCKEQINLPRKTKWRKKPKGNSKRGRPCKPNSLNRMIYVLEWLSSGDFGNKMEFELKYSKTSLTEDRSHILRAICKALKDEIQWPNAAERLDLASTYKGIFKDVVGIFDCTEWVIAKPGEENHEKRTYSGKQQANTYKTLAVINKHGKFIYVSRLMEGQANDRAQFVQSELYMECGKFFTGSEKLAADSIYISIIYIYLKGFMSHVFLVASAGGFRGDGPHFCSYDVLGDEDKKLFNLAFKVLNSHHSATLLLYNND